MNISINLTLDQEQQDALTAKVAARNAARAEGAPEYTITSHLQEVIEADIDSTVAEAYQAAVTRLGVIFRARPYEVRLQTIEQLEAAAGE